MEYRTRGLGQLIVDFLVLAGLLALAFAASPTRAATDGLGFAQLPIIRIDAIRIAPPIWDSGS